MYRVGADIGSTYTKYCVLDARGGISVLDHEPTPVRQKEHFDRKIMELRERYGDCRIVTCGYGRKNLEHVRMVTELAALAAGAERMCPDYPAILDIGGQDTKLIRQEGGKLRAFFVNEKCAAGSGLFLGNVLRLLGMEIPDIDLEKTGGMEQEGCLSSVCAVFAQSEIVELIAEGVSEGDIVRAVLRHILTQARILLGKMDCGEIALSGGLTRITGIAGLAEAILQRPVFLPEHAAYLSAIGCAEMAGEI